MSTDFDQLVRDVCDDLLDRPGDPSTLAADLVRSHAPLLPRTEVERITELVLAEVTGLGQLEALLDDPHVSEVMVNGAREVWVERRGHLERAGHLPDGRVDALVERILAPIGRRLDRASPVVDARLADGSRVCAVGPPVAVDGTCVCIRRFRVRPVGLDEFAPPDVVGLLGEVVASRCNVLVSGATSAGKTTLLNALVGLVPRGERLVTLEDTAELQLATDHVVRLEARPAAADGPPPVTLTQLLRAALRLRPDRLVVGEVRGDEALDLLQALHTGHDGSMATVHANGPRDALRRLVAMVLQGHTIPADTLGHLVRSAVDVIVHVERGADGSRRIAEVAELGQPWEPTSEVRPLVTSGTTVAPLRRRRRP